jgi:hypothetical protein
VVQEEGVVMTCADVNGFRLAELRFPPGYAQPSFAPELPYLALVVEGAVEKTFRLRTVTLGPDSAVTMPVAAEHSARFGAQGARIVIVRARDAEAPVARCLRTLADLRVLGRSGERAGARVVPPPDAIHGPAWARRRAGFRSSVACQGGAISSGWLYER